MASYKCHRLTYIWSNYACTAANDVKYTFEYDEFGNTRSVLVGTQPLITHTYAANNGLLTRSDYGNGAYTAPTYDSLDRVTAMSYNGVEKFNWIYGKDGNIGIHNDLVNNVTWRYEYTKEGDITSAIGSNGTRFNYTYDTATGKLLSVKATSGGVGKTTTYNYSDHTSGDKKNLVESVVLPTGTITYDYDGFYRASYDVEINNVDKLTTDFTFLNGTATNSTTTVVGSMTNAGNEWSSTTSYEYDENGNIETVSEDGVQKAKYYYDELNQLVREDNAWINKTIAYTYDKGGNILAVNEYDYTAGSLDGLVATTTNTYAYGDSNWKDKLTGYNGNAITYDAIGNPLSYYNGFNFTWQHGRQLASISGDGLTASYKYDAEGIRTQKTVNGVTTNYVLEGDTVVKETNGTDTLWYYYDAAGDIISLELNGTAYFYVKNMQGDIIAITNASGTKVVEYTYDSWGKLISISGSLASTVGVKNPYRYRGYRYDTETGHYYINTRYYDPEIGRFINADGYIQTPNGDTTSTNMFAYCGNNPVDRYDPNGEGFFTATICGIAVWKLGVAFAGLVTTYIIADSIVKNPPVFPPISLPKIEIKPKTETKEKDKEKTITVPQKPRKDPFHHIVAQNDRRAQPAQEVLETVGINRFTDPANLVQLPAFYHYRIHSEAYYDYVNTVIVNAYQAGGRESVYSALAVLKWEISSGAIW